MSATVSFLGVGLYPMSEAAGLVGMKPGKLRRWVRDYEYTAHDKKYSHHSLVKRWFDESEPTLTFLELMELHFIKMFRSKGVSMPTIRRAAEAAARKFKTDYPFAVKRFDTDGRKIFVTLQKENAGKEHARIVEDLSHGQQVFEQIMRPFFKKLEYGRKKEVVRYWPLEISGRVVLDPQRKFGRPIDAETGAPTRALYQAFMADEKQTEQAVAAWFGVPLGAVKSAIRFEQSLVQ